MKPETTQSFSPTIINWYNAHKRDLPWRHTTDPYKIWLSEIILQQTRVVQGYNYYLRFVENYPTVSDLAGATEDEVLKLWQGLGYYSRARNLHAAAQSIVEKYDGVFPTNYVDILALKGVGEYTAAAICSFAYNQPYAVVDGNVFRVLSRVFGIETPIDSTAGKKQFAKLAGNLLDKKKPLLHNQAIMEFGALQCTPQQPGCASCPLQNDCVAFLTNCISELPRKEQKTKQRERFFHYFYLKNNGKTYLQKRTGKDVWQNLYEFPLIETGRQLEIDELMQTESFKTLFQGIKNITFEGSPLELKHVLSHRIIRAKFYTVSIDSENNQLETRIKIDIEKRHDYPVSRLTGIFLEKQ